MNPDEKRVLAKAQTLNHWTTQKLFYHVGKNFQRKWTVKRGEVYFVDLGDNIGSEENLPKIIRLNLFKEKWNI